MGGGARAEIVSLRDDLTLHLLIPAIHVADEAHKPGDVIGKAIRRPYNRGYGCAPGMCVQWPPLLRSLSDSLKVSSLAMGLLEVRAITTP